MSSIRKVVIAAAFAVGAYPLTLRSQTRVTEDDVVRCMMRGGYSVQVKQVSMPSTIPAKIERPDLELMKIEPASAAQSRVLLRCAVRSACIPFYAMVTGLASEKKVGGFVNESATSNNRTAEPPFMKRGETATLELVSRQMLITLPVICLQNGRIGERIRVTSSDRKVSYVGEIVRKGLLRSSL